MKDLKEERLKRGMSGTFVSKQLGFSKQALSAWENGKNKCPYEVVMKLAEIYGTTVDYLLEREPAEPKIAMQVGELVAIPIVGRVSCGYGAAAVEEFTGDYFQLDGSMLRGYDRNECRILKAHGDSMYPLILEGDTIVVHCQQDVDSGEVAVIMLEDDETTLKRVVKVEGGSTMLVPQNPKYQSRIIAPGESARIYGRVIQIVRPL